MILKQVTIVTIFTGVNLFATLLNQLVMAYLFGASASMDAFLASGVVPFAVLNMAIGDMSYVLVPMLLRYEQSREVRAAIDSTFTMTALLAIGVSTVGILGHRVFLQLTTSASMPAATFELAASLAPLIWVITGLTVAGSFLTGVHHYSRSFSLPAITLAIPYAGMIAGGLLGAGHIGIFSVVWGWAAGTVARDIVLYFWLPGARPKLTLNIAHPANRQLLNTLTPLCMSLLPFTILPLIDVFWASRLPVGSISYLGYSNRIVIALTAIVVQGISVVLFPHLSQLLANNQTAAFRSRAQEAIKMILFIMFPLAVLVGVLRSSLLEVLLVRGNFSSLAAARVAQVLPLYLLGTIWMAAMNLVSRGFFALRDYSTPALAGLAGIVLYFISVGLLIGRFSYVGVGFAYAGFWLLTFFFQLYLLGRAVGTFFTRDLFLVLGKVALSALIAGIAVDLLFHPTSVASLGLTGILLAAGVGAGTFFAIGHFVLRVPQCRMLLDIISRRHATAGAPLNT